MPKEVEGTPSASVKAIAINHLIFVCISSLPFPDDSIDRL